MKKTLRITLLLTAISAAPLAAQAVMNPPPPPSVLWIQRELVKAGKGPAHNDYEAGWPAAFGKANWPTTYLGANALTGTNEAWFFIGYPSFEALEKDLAQSDANVPLSAELKRLTGGDSDYLESSSAVLLQYMPSLSYKPVVEIPKMRYFEILRYTVRPGHEGDFVKAAAIYRDGFTKGAIDNHWATYRVVSGMPAGTYLVIVPMRSLSMFDRTGAEDEAMARALGPEQMGALGKLVSDGFATIQSQVFAFNPKMSYVSKEWKAADPFWR